VKENIVPASPCTHCGEPNDGAASLEGATPKPGDITICMECGNIMAFAEDLTVRNLTNEEMYEIAGREDLLAMQRLLQDFRKKK
jgi:hypothetical protein